MPATHAQIARELVAKLPAGIFAHAVRDAALHNDYLKLERMLPGMKFAVRKVSQDEWELAGTAEDGSTVLWRAGA